VSILALRVAARYQAGLLYPPPAMFRDIYDWVLAVVAATALESRGQKEAPDFSRFDPVLQAAEAYRANPTNWKLYVALYEAMWIFGHPGQRASVKDFQKLTPEKKESLVQRAERLYEYVQKHIQGNKDFILRNNQKEEAESAQLRQYLLPGVSAMQGDTVEKEFPIDLTGWKYGEEEIRKRVEEIVQRDKARAKKFYEEQSVRQVKPEFEADKRDLLEALKRQMDKAEWDSIRVVLNRAGLKGVKAYWQAGQRKIVIEIPYDSRPDTLTDLASTLRHEMQHFSQSYLAYTLDRFEGPGLPSRDIRNPEYKQWMSPSHPSYRPEEPDTKKLYQKLKEEGISPERVNFHDLDDIEFYTELVDAIDEFKKLLSYAPKGPLNTAVKLFTGVIPVPNVNDKDWHEQMNALGGYEFAKLFTRPNKAFMAWKTHSPGKYKKALKEFVSAVVHG
jgi:hypothetical protein